MEHLIFEPTDRHEVAFAFHEPVLTTNWKTKDNLIDFVEPKTRWSGFKHDSVSFCRPEDYPSEAGYDSSCLWNGNLRACRDDLSTLTGDEVAHSVAGFVQAWLYFNFLENIVGKKIAVSYLVRADTDGVEWLYSRNLHFCLQATVFKIRQEQDDENKARISTDVQLLLRTMHTWVSRLMRLSHPSFRPKLDQQYPGFMDEIEQMLPAIIRLAEAIEQTRSYALPYFKTLGTSTWHYPFNVLERRRSAIEALGWCPFQIQMLDDTTNHSTMDWICSAKVVQDRTGHETCTERKCARNDIDQSTYIQAHICATESCKKVLPGADTVINILKNNEIPIIEVAAENNKLTVAIVPVPKDVPGDYIAFSHVWADGIGGVAEDGLNECQFDHLTHLCRSFSNSRQNIRFWLDSLCIPSPERDEEAFESALVGIRDVYINASCTMVLDRKIERCLTSDSTERLYAYIYLSAWMQRMWTYEEAVLGKQLAFVLRDGFHIYRPDTEPSMRKTISVVWKCLATQLYRLRVEHGKLNIGHIYQALRYRLTNVPSEEFLSASGMLGLDTRLIMQFHGGSEERVQQFWLMLKWVPYDVIFSDCPKLTARGFRWAPKTMMYPSQTALDTEMEGTKSECTTRGLIGSYLMLALDPVLEGSRRSVTQRGSVFYVFVNEKSSVKRVDDDSHTGLLRIYCTETWPPAPMYAPFSAIALSGESKEVPAAGRWVAGAALMQYDMKDEETSADGVLPLGDARLSTFDIRAVSAYEYAGRVLIERLPSYELSSKAGTVMFEGSNKTIIDAQGYWHTGRICIT